jgi:hypothetical protein
MMEFTKQQLKDFEAYERVRVRGLYNMFDPRARESIGLSKERYLFVMDNYSALKIAFKEQEKAKNASRAG